MTVNGRVAVRLTPRATRNEIVGFAGEALRVRVMALPVDGRANDALVRLVAEALGVAASRVRVVGGQTARQKVLEVEGLSAEEVRRRVTPA